MFMAEVLLGNYATKAAWLNSQPHLTRLLHYLAKQTRKNCTISLNFSKTQNTFKWGLL